MPARCRCLQTDGASTVLTCVLQRLLQAPLRLSELLQNLKILLHGVSVPQAHTQQDTHSYTHRDPPQDTDIQTDQFLHTETGHTPEPTEPTHPRARVCACV